MTEGSVQSPETMKIPFIIYGTAWKKEQTKDLVIKAITTGFRAIDTAAQPKHYNEKGVGEALHYLEGHGFSRDKLFIQTKFTPLSGQDPSRIPYDEHAPLALQVAQSFSSSQKNLGTEFVNSLVLHSPLKNWAEMLEVWKAMEALYGYGGAKQLGISNCYDLDILRALYDQSSVKPSILQNRFYSDTHYDLEIREWCLQKNITNQSFWTLTANPHILDHPQFRQISSAHKKTEAQVLFRFLNQRGVVPLSGTRSEVHMRDDLEILEFELSRNEMEEIQTLLNS